MPADRWKSLGTTELQSANKKAQEFIQEKEREAAGSIEPKLARDAAQCPLVQHLNDYEAVMPTFTHCATLGRHSCGNTASPDNFARKQMRHQNIKQTDGYTDEAQLPIYDAIKNLPRLIKYTQIRAQIE